MANERRGCVHGSTTITRWFEPSPGQVREHEQFLADLPEVVRRVAAQFPPWECFIYHPTARLVWVGQFALQGWRRGPVQVALTVLGVNDAAPAERCLAGDLWPFDGPLPNGHSATVMCDAALGDVVINSIRGAIDAVRFPPPMSGDITVH